MKRMLLAVVPGALIGALCFSAPPAHADQPPLLIVQPNTAPLLNSHGGFNVSGTPPPVVVVVRSGDTLSQIAASNRTTWEALAAFNHVNDPNIIMVGQRIEIPPADWRIPAGWVPPAAAALPEVPGAGSPSVMPGHSDVRVSSAGGPAPNASGVWGCIAAHESGGNPATNTGNGYYGAFQDTVGSWQAAGGGPGLPSSYSYATQLAVNERIQQQQGWGAWPQTSLMCGV